MRPRFLVLITALLCGAVLASSAGAAEPAPVEASRAQAGHVRPGPDGHEVLLHPRPQARRADQGPGANRQHRRENRHRVPVSRRRHHRPDERRRLPVAAVASSGRRFVGGSVALACHARARCGCGRPVHLSACRSPRGRATTWAASWPRTRRSRSRATAARCRSRSAT